MITTRQSIEVDVDGVNLVDVDVDGEVWLVREGTLISAASAPLILAALYTALCPGTPLPGAIDLLIARRITIRSAIDET